MRRLENTVARKLCGWRNAALRAILANMIAFPEDSLPTDFALELEEKFFWWEPVGSQPRSKARILAQAMNFASFEDILRLEKKLGSHPLAEVMFGAQPGWISDRSWEFWRGRLILATGRAIPEVPPRRSFNAGMV